MGPNFHVRQLILAKSSYPTLKERSAPSTSSTSVAFQQPSLHREIHRQPAYPSTYQIQPDSTYRDRLATATYDALGAGDIHTANKRFEYLVRADGNDF